ncbi:hypothetical protein GCM10010129_29050 [Streptomyces fumigatiscleroticus]|nr:hypothetical protein GCM10010129_29050 [Streptomyces fumigatiscleroticus]
MSAVPTPATIEAAPPTASRTAATSADFSASLVVGDSPVVPDSTSPSQPCATSRAASRWAPSRSSAPFSVKGVIMAHRARPKGGAEGGKERFAVMGVVSMAVIVKLHLNLLRGIGKGCCDMGEIERIDLGEVPYEEAVSPSTSPPIWWSSPGSPPADCPRSR